MADFEYNSAIEPILQNRVYKDLPLEGKINVLENYGQQFAAENPDRSDSILELTAYRKYNQRLEEIQKQYEQSEESPVYRGIEPANLSEGLTLNQDRLNFKRFPTLSQVSNLGGGFTLGEEFQQRVAEGSLGNTELDFGLRQAREGLQSDLGNAFAEFEPVKIASTDNRSYVIARQKKSARSDKRNSWEVQTSDGLIEVAGIDKLTAEQLAQAKKNVPETLNFLLRKVDETGDASPVLGSEVFAELQNWQGGENEKKMVARQALIAIESKMDKLEVGSEPLNLDGKTVQLAKQANFFRQMLIEQETKELVRGGVAGTKQLNEFDRTWLGEGLVAEYESSGDASAFSNKWIDTVQRASDRGAITLMSMTDSLAYRYNNDMIKKLEERKSALAQDGLQDMQLEALLDKRKKEAEKIATQLFLAQSQVNLTGTSVALQRFNQNSKKIKDFPSFLEVTSDDFFTWTTDAFVESTVSQLPIMLIGGPALRGATAAWGLAGGAMTVGALAGVSENVFGYTESLNSAMKEHGFEPSDPKSFTEALTNADVVVRANDIALSRSAAIGITNGAFYALTKPFLNVIDKALVASGAAKSRLGTNFGVALTNTTAFVKEPFEEAIGERLAQLGAGTEFDLGAVILEGLSSTGLGSVGEGPSMFMGDNNPRLLDARSFEELQGYLAASPTVGAIPKAVEAVTAQTAQTAMQAANADGTVDVSKIPTTVIDAEVKDPQQRPFSIETITGSPEVDLTLTLPDGSQVRKRVHKDVGEMVGKGVARLTRAGNLASIVEETPDSITFFKKGQRLQITRASLGDRYDDAATEIKAESKRVNSVKEADSYLDVPVYVNLEKSLLNFAQSNALSDAQGKNRNILGSESIKVGIEAVFAMDKIMAGRLSIRYNLPIFPQDLANARLEGKTIGTFGEFSGRAGSFTYSKNKLEFYGNADITTLLEELDHQTLDLFGNLLFSSSEQKELDTLLQEQAKKAAKAEKKNAVGRLVGKFGTGVRNDDGRWSAVGQETFAGLMLDFRHKAGDLTDVSPKVKEILTKVVGFQSEVFAEIGDQRFTNLSLESLDFFRNFYHIPPTLVKDFFSEAEKRSRVVEGNEVDGDEIANLINEGKELPDALHVSGPIQVDVTTLDDILEREEIKEIIQKQEPVSKERVETERISVPNAVLSLSLTETQRKEVYGLIPKSELLQEGEVVYTGDSIYRRNADGTYDQYSVVNDEIIIDKSVELPDSVVNDSRSKIYTKETFDSAYEEYQSAEEKPKLSQLLAEKGEKNGKEAVEGETAEEALQGLSAASEEARSAAIKKWLQNKGVLKKDGSLSKKKKASWVRVEEPEVLFQDRRQPGFSQQLMHKASSGLKAILVKNDYKQLAGSTLDKIVTERFNSYNDVMQNLTDFMKMVNLPDSELDRMFYVDASYGATGQAGRMLYGIRISDELQGLLRQEELGNLTYLPRGMTRSQLININEALILQIEKKQLSAGRVGAISKYAYETTPEQRVTDTEVLVANSSKKFNELLSAIREISRAYQEESGQKERPSDEKIKILLAEKGYNGFFLNVAKKYWSIRFKPKSWEGDALQAFSDAGLIQKISKERRENILELARLMDKVGKESPQAMLLSPMLTTAIAREKGVPLIDLLLAIPINTWLASVKTFVANIYGFGILAPINYAISTMTQMQQIAQDLRITGDSTQPNSPTIQYSKALAIALPAYFAGINKSITNANAWGFALSESRYILTMGGKGKSNEVLEKALGYTRPMASALLGEPNMPDSFTDSLARLVFTLLVDGGTRIATAPDAFAKAMGMEAYLARDLYVQAATNWAKMTPGERLMQKNKDGTGKSQSEYVRDSVDQGLGVADYAAQREKAKKFVSENEGVFRNNSLAINRQSKSVVDNLIDVLGYYNILEQRQNKLQEMMNKASREGYAAAYAGELSPVASMVERGVNALSMSEGWNRILDDNVGTFGQMTLMGRTVRFRLGSSPFKIFQPFVATPLRIVDEQANWSFVFAPLKVGVQKGFEGLMNKDQLPDEDPNVEVMPMEQIAQVGIKWVLGTAMMAFAAWKVGVGPDEDDWGFSGSQGLTYKDTAKKDGVVPPYSIWFKTKDGKISIQKYDQAPQLMQSIGVGASIAEDLQRNPKYQFAVTDDDKFTTATLWAGSMLLNSSASLQDPAPLDGALGLADLFSLRSEGWKGDQARYKMTQIIRPFFNPLYRAQEEGIQTWNAFRSDNTIPTASKEDFWAQMYVGTLMYPVVNAASQGRMAQNVGFRIDKTTGSDESPRRVPVLTMLEWKRMSGGMSWMLANNVRIPDPQMNKGYTNLVTKKQHNRYFLANAVNAESGTFMMAHASEAEAMATPIYLNWLTEYSKDTGRHEQLKAFAEGPTNRLNLKSKNSPQTYRSLLESDVSKVVQQARQIAYLQTYAEHYAKTPEAKGLALAYAERLKVKGYQLEKVEEKVGEAIP